MKKTIICLISISLLMTVNLYAQTDGNLIVEGNAYIYDNAGIGIGTSTPGHRLTVKGAVNDGIALLNQSDLVATLFDTNSEGAGRLKLYDGYGNVLMQFVAEGSTYFKKTSISVMGLSGETMFQVNPDSGNSYFENGNVGIGTTSPQSKLAVSGLPTSPPDSSGTKGMVCITYDGNMWVDSNGAMNCDDSN